MKLSLFNRPTIGVSAGLDPITIAAGTIAVCSMALFYPWFFMGG